MNKWNCLILLLLVTACSSPEKPKTPDQLQPAEMPASVRDLYEQAAQKPDSVGLRLHLVDALDSLGAFKLALAQIDSLIGKDSLNYGFWYRKALLQQDSQDTTGALHSFRYAIRIYPSPDAVLAAANLLAERKDSTALMLTRQIRAQRLGNEYDAHCYFISGVYYARVGNTKKALESFDACIYADFRYMEAYMEKGFLFYEARKLVDAEQVFSAAVRIRSTYADAYYWLAKTQEALNQPAAAVNNYQQALKLDPGIAEAAAALKRLGK
jgi:tetratricopeptide (TPR) repeat protein